MLELGKAGKGGPYTYGDESMFCFLPEYLEFREGKVMLTPEVRRWYAEEKERRIQARGLDVGPPAVVALQTAVGYSGGGYAQAVTVGVQPMYAPAGPRAVQGYSGVVTSAAQKALVAERRRVAMCYRCGEMGHYMPECTATSCKRGFPIPFHVDGFKPAYFAPASYVPVKVTPLEIQQHAQLLAQIQPRPPPPK